MLSKILKSRHLWIIGMAGIVMALLFLSAVGCSSEKETKTTVSKSKRSTSRPVASKPAPVTPAPAPAPVVPAPVVEDTPEVMVAEAPREVSYEEAEAAYYERRYEAATEMFTQYTARKRQNPWGHYMLGLSAWKSGDHVKSIEAFELALEIDPKHVKSWVNLSRVLLDDERPDDAIAKIEEAIALDPESNTGYRLKGRALHQLHRKAEAVVAYQRAIELNDEDIWSMNNLGLTYIEVGQFEDALPPLARAVEIESGVPLFYNNLGMVLERLGHYREAEAAYQTAVDLDDTYFNAASNLSRISDVLEDPAIQPIDLAAAAQRFVDQISEWRTASLDSTTVEEEPEEIVASEPDKQPEDEELFSSTELSEGGEEEE